MFLPCSCHVLALLFHPHPHHYHGRMLLQLWWRCWWLLQLWWRCWRLRQCWLLLQHWQRCWLLLQLWWRCWGPRQCKLQLWWRCWLLLQLTPCMYSHPQGIEAHNVSCLPSASHPLPKVTDAFPPLPHHSGHATSGAGSNASRPDLHDRGCALLVRVATNQEKLLVHKRLGLFETQVTAITAVTHPPAN